MLLRCLNRKVKKVSRKLIDFDLELPEKKFATTPSESGRLFRFREITEKFCYYPLPPPPNLVGFWRSRKITGTTPPPHRIWSAPEVTENLPGHIGRVAPPQTKILATPLPSGQAKVSVHCRWPLIRGNLTLKCVGRGIDNVAVQGRWPLTTGVAQGRYYCNKDSSIFLAMIRSERPHILLPVDMMTFVASSDQIHLHAL